MNLGAPKRAVFLDRDGVINVSPGQGYVRSWAEFAFLPGALEALRDLTQTGFQLFVVSNQSGVAHGFYTESALNEITTRMRAAVKQAGGQLTAIRYCLHAPDAQCDCRKPKRGLIDQITRRHPVDLARSYLIGDDAKDIALGQAVGCRTVLVLSGRTRPEMVGAITPPPDQVCRDLREAAEWIVHQ